MADIDSVVTKLQKLGLTESKAKETAKNKGLSSNLLQVLDLAEDKDVSGSRGNLLYHVASKVKPQIWGLVPVLVRSGYFSFTKILMSINLRLKVNNVVTDQMPNPTIWGEMPRK